MKLEIYGEAETEKVVRLKLVQVGNAIVLVAVDEAGKQLDCSDLITFGTNGVELHPGVNPEIGLPLDGKRRLKLHCYEPALTDKQCEAIRTAFNALTINGCASSAKILKAVFEGAFK